VSPRDEAHRTGRTPPLPRTFRPVGVVPGDHWLERRALAGLDPMDLEESERAYELERRERLDDFTPVSGLFRVGRPLAYRSSFHNKGDT
jgi:hypothetical protein